MNRGWENETSFSERANCLATSTTAPRVSFCGTDSSTLTSQQLKTTENYVRVIELYNVGAAQSIGRPQRMGEAT